MTLVGVPAGQTDFRKRRGLFDYAVKRALGADALAKFANAATMLTTKLFRQGYRMHARLIRKFVKRWRRLHR